MIMLNQSVPHLFNLLVQHGSFFSFFFFGSHFFGFQMQHYPACWPFSSTFYKYMYLGLHFSVVHFWIFQIGYPKLFTVLTVPQVQEVTVLKNMWCVQLVTLFISIKTVLRTMYNVGVKVCCHIAYPNHTQRSRRHKSGTQLLKRVKSARGYKFVPFRVYP